MITNFSKGIWCDKLNSRVDIEGYSSSLKQCDNFDIPASGGIFFRPGFRYQFDAYSNSNDALLIPFLHSNGTKYLLEVTSGVIRIFEGTSLVYTVEQSGLASADTNDVHYQIVGDEIYFTQPNGDPFKLSGGYDDTWSMKKMISYPYPPKINSYAARDSVTITGPTSYNTWTVTADNDIECFLYYGDIGRRVVALSPNRGIGIIVATSSKTASINIIEEFSSLTLGTSEWEIQGFGGGSSITPSVTGPEGAAVWLESEWKTFRQFTYNMEQGRYLNINGGLIELVSQGPDEWGYNGTIVKLLESTAESYAWEMYKKELHLNHGPRVLAYYNDRLFLGANDSKPNYIWGSTIRNFTDFNPIVGDANGTISKLRSSVSEKIQWMIGGQALMVGTVGGIWSIGLNKALLPFSQRNQIIAKQHEIPCSSVKPVSIGDRIIFASRDNTRLYSIINGPDDSPPIDLTLLSDQFSADVTIKHLCVQGAPCARVWVVDSVGDLWGFNYNDPQKPPTWFKFSTDGKILTLAVLPGADDESELWVVTERTVNGTEQRFIEKLAYGHYLDLSANYSGAETSVIGDFSYLCGYFNLADFDSTETKRLYEHDDYLYCCHGNSVSRSSDGETWTQLGGIVDDIVYCLIWFGGTLYAGTAMSSKIYEWTGSTWSEVYTFPSSNVVHSLCEFDGYVYAGIDFTGKIYRSSDMTSWTEVTTLTSQYQITCMCVHSGKLYASTAGTGQGVWNTSDGTSWSNVFTDADAVYDMISFGSYIYLGLKDGRIYRSTDGASWAEVRSDSGTDINCFGTNGTTLYVGNENKLLSTTNGTGYTTEWYDNEINKFNAIAFLGGGIYIALRRAYKYGIYALGSEPHAVVTQEDGYIGEYSIGSDGQVDISPYTTVNADIGILYNGVAQTINTNTGIDKTRFKKTQVSLLESRSGKIGCQVEQDGSVDYIDIFESAQGSGYSGTKQKTLLTGSGKEIYFYIKQEDPLPLNVLAMEFGED